MKTLCTTLWAASFIAAGVFLLSLWSGNGSQAFALENPVQADGSKPKKSQQSVDQEELKKATYRTRQTVKMLDDIYKGGIVTITDKYVTEESEIPAGTAFKQIFAIAKAKGWHEVRLLDVTGDPYDDENVAVDDFEKRAVKKIAAGETFYEEIEDSQGQKYFRAMTAIPVVFEKCIQCHSNYEDVPAGQAFGALGYRIKIELDGDMDLSKAP